MDGSRVVSGSLDKTVKVWNVETGELLHTLEGHSGWVMSVAMDGSRVVSGSEDKTVKVWNVETGELLHTLEGHSKVVRRVAVSGSLASSTDSGGITKCWDLDAGRELDDASAPAIAHGDPSCLAKAGVRRPLGHIALRTDDSTAARPPFGLVAGDRAVVWKDHLVHILVLEGASTV